MRNNKQRYLCNQCKSYFSLEVNNIKSNPVIAIIDIESLPAISYHWGMWNQNLYQEQMIEDVCFLSWSGKYLGGDLHSDILTSKEAITRDASRITQSIWNFLSKVDIVIGHNITQYDSKLISSNFLLYNKNPLTYKIIDTLTVARSVFKFTSNKLSFINNKLGLVNKLEHEGFTLWKKCAEGNKESLKLMREYNEQDVVSTEALYLRLRPYIKNHPSVALYNDEESLSCPNCGSNVEEEGQTRTKTGVYTSYRCTECGAIHRGKENLLTKEKRNSLLT